MTAPNGDAMAAVLVQLAEQAEAIADLRARLDAIGGSEDQAEDEGKGYRPHPAPRWWLCGDPALTREQQEALAGSLAFLRGWVTQIYRPMYGHLAETLPRCWERHPLCLTTLDFLAELWGALYLQPRRASLVTQADFQTRILPAAADQMARECEDCGHRVVRSA